MKHIQAVKTNTLQAREGCGQCQSSCQSACKTSCTVANQSCEHKEK